MATRIETQQGGVMDEFLLELLAGTPQPGDGRRNAALDDAPQAAVEPVTKVAELPTPAPPDDVDISLTAVQEAAVRSLMVAALSEETALKDASELSEVTALREATASSEVTALREATALKEAAALKEGAALKDAAVSNEGTALKDEMPLKEDQPNWAAAAPSAPVMVEPMASTPALEAPPPAIGLERLIAAIDSEASSVPRPKFETKVDSPARTRADQKKNCILFSLEETRYAVSLGNVLEMDKIPRITPVPNVPGYVRGVTNLRGDIVCVLDLRVLLGLPPSEHADRGRILVVRAAGGHQAAALVVDEVRGIATIPLDKLKPPAGVIQDKVSSVLAGVCEYGDALLNVLSLEELFRSPEIRRFEIN